MIPISTLATKNKNESENIYLIPNNDTKEQEKYLYNLFIKIVQLYKNWYIKTKLQEVGNFQSSIFPVEGK